MSFVSVAASKLVELVVEQIHCGIFNGAFQRDRKLLAQHEMTASCGGSHGVVREAIKGGGGASTRKGRAVNNADSQRRIERPGMRRATSGAGQ